MENSQVKSGPQSWLTLLGFQLPVDLALVTFCYFGSTLIPSRWYFSFVLSGFHNCLQHNCLQRMVGPSFLSSPICKRVIILVTSYHCRESYVSFILVKRWEQCLAWRKHFVRVGWNYSIRNSFLSQLSRAISTSQYPLCLLRSRMPILFLVLSVNCLCVSLGKLLGYFPEFWLLWSFGRLNLHLSHTLAGCLVGPLMWRVPSLFSSANGLEWSLRWFFSSVGLVLLLNC